MKIYFKTHKRVKNISHPCSEGPNDAISTKFGTVVDLIYIIIYANFGWYRLKGGHSVIV